MAAAQEEGLDAKKADRLLGTTNARATQSIMAYWSILRRNKAFDRNMLSLDDRKGKEGEGIKVFLWEGDRPGMGKITK